MECVFFTGTNCKGTRAHEYTPSEEELKQYCQSDNFKNCPRYSPLMTLETSKAK